MSIYFYSDILNTWHIGSLEWESVFRHSDFSNSWICLDMHKIVSAGTPSRICVYFRITENDLNLQSNLPSILECWRTVRVRSNCRSPNWSKNNTSTNLIHRRTPYFRIVSSFVYAYAVHSCFYFYLYLYLCLCLYL